MSTRHHKHPWVTAVCAACAIVLVGAATASAAPIDAARTTNVRMTLIGKLGKAGASGPVTGAPCGRGRFVSTILPPQVKYTFTCRGGTFRLIATNRLNGSSVTGSWRTVSGTRRFRHMRGHGPLRGSLRPGAAFHLTGRVSGL